MYLLYVWACDLQILQKSAFICFILSKSGRRKPSLSMWDYVVRQNWETTQLNLVIFAILFDFLFNPSLWKSQL